MGRSALIVVDMLSAYDDDDAGKLVPAIEETLARMAGLAKRALDEDAFR